ncbi:hypothetical protein JL720_7530 [Aureococcus anophagefferens]|nr:hypothetical protein JL720_7530 [Aureococcus anophagefferens]
MRAWQSIVILFLLGSLAPKASGQQLAKLLASDAAAEDYFGYSVAISGDLVVVGAYRDDDAGSKTGSAYVFRTTNDGGSWTQTAKLVASDAAGQLLRQIRRHQRRLVVAGADGNNEDVGSAYVFRTRNGGASWSQTAKLLASDAAKDDVFGESVAISGDLVVVGAYGNNDAGSSSGSAYVFRTRNSGASWTQTAKLLASDAAAEDYFGYSVAISGDLVVVGAYRDDDAGSKTGSAYVFRTTNDGGSWTQTAKLVASDAAKDNYFGKSVAISGDLVVVGADGNNEDTAKLVASDAAAKDNFGYSVAISGDLVVVGAYEDDDAGSSSGSAYVLPADGSAVTPRPTLRPTRGGTSGGGTDTLVVVAAAVAGALVAVLACLCIKRRHGAPPERNVPFAPAWMAPGDGLETHSVEELKAMANTRGVSLAGRFEKTDIIAALRAAAPVDAVAVPVDDASTGAWNVAGAASASTVPAAAVPSAPRPPPMNPGFAAAPMSTLHYEAAQ